MNNKLKTDKRFKDRILREQIRLAIRQLPMMQTASFIVALVLSFTVRHIVPNENLLIWLLMILVVVVSRIVLYFRFHKIHAEAFSGDYWKNIYLILALVSGSAWGLSAFLIFPVGNQGLIALFVLVIASLSAATTVSHGSIRSGPAAWAGPAMLLYACRCYLEGGQFEYTIGFLIILYLLTVLRYSVIQNDVITAAISLKFENLELLEEVRKGSEVLEKRVEERTSELQRANARLMVEIDERRSTADALHRSEEQYRELVENANSIILRMDKIGNVTFYNRFAQHFFGYREDEIIGKNVVGTIVPELESTGRDLRFLIEDIGKNPGLYENNTNENVRRNGERVWVAWTNRPILDKDGHVMEILCIGNDITERKVAEERLKDSEQLLQSIIQGYPIPAFMVGEDHRVIHWNKALEKLSGIQASTAIGTSEHWRAFYREERPCMADLLVNGDQETIAHWYAESASKSEVLDEAYEATQFFPDLGETGKWLHFTAAAVRNSRGIVVGAIETLEDVTALKKAEEVLRESEDRYRAIFENTGTVIIIVEEDTTISIANMEFEKLTGYRRDEVENKKTWTEFVAKEDLERMLIQHRLRRLDADAAQRQYEFRLIDKHGQTKDVLLTVDLIAGTKRSVASLLDITKRKRAEKELREANEYLNNLFNYANAPIIVWDPEFRITRFNHAFEKLTGRTTGDVLGKNLEILFPPALVESSMQLIKKTLLGERWETVEISVLHVNGSVRTVLWNSATIFAGDGTTPVGTIAQGHDITDRKRAEEKYRSIFENAVEGIYQTTPDGRFISINPAFARIIGYDSAEDVLRTIKDIPRQIFVNPETHAHLIRLLEQDSTVKDFETLFLRKDKTTASVTLNAHAVCDRSGKLAHIEGTAVDITDRKALEGRLIQAQKIEAIGTLAGGIAHDFNNILSGIIGYTEMARKRTEQPTLHGYLEQVLKACERAKDLVGQILTFSRATQQELKPVDMASLTKEGLKLLRATTPSTITFHSRIHKGVYAVLADPTQIHQVLINLCTNAAHAMRERGGDLWVSLDNVNITPQMKPLYVDLNPGPHVKLMVADSGGGIAAGVIDRIFDPFFTTKKTGEGTGLGLSVVYGIVKGCGGTITVNSKLGEGTVFSVYLPAITNIAELAPDTEEPIPGGSERILLVDDEEVLVEMWCNVLEDLGYTVTATTESAEALEIFLSRPDQFDLVITDMTMPGMTGVGLAREILIIRPAIPIILCTGFSELIAEDEAKALGIREFVMKPFTTGHIAQLIRKVLE